VLLPDVFRAGRFTSRPVEYAQKCLAIGSPAAVQEELLGLRSGDFLGSGNDQELVDACSIAFAYGFKSRFERNR